MTQILFINYAGVYGGAERVLLDCAAGVEGHHVLVCPPGPLSERARAAGLTVLPLPERSLRARGSIAARATGVTALLAHAAELRALARDLDPELVMAWGMRSTLAALALPRSRPVGIDHHDYLPGPLIGAGVRRAARRAAVVTVETRDLARELGAGTVVAPGVDVERFAAIGAPPQPESVLVLGALSAYKRPELALEIVAHARRTLPGLCLRVVGVPLTEHDHGRVEAMAARAAQPDLAGGVEILSTGGDTETELARAQCLLHCADREPFGIVLLEAMAAGRPVVAPAAGGPAEIVTPETGRLYPPGDPAAGARALTEALASDLGGEAGRRRAREFSSARTRAGFRAALAPFVGRRAGASGQGLAVVTVTHNSAAVLPVLLSSVRRHLPGAELIVVDSASTDDSVRVARDTPGVTVIALPDNVGFGRACNRGVAAAAAPACALLNPDVELVDGSLAALAAEALRADRPPRLLAPLVLNADGSRQQSAHPVPCSPADLARALLPPGLAPGPAGTWLAPWRSRRPRPVGWATGAALVAPTATLRELGPFDEAIFMYGEDLELGLHAAAAGVRTWFWPTARVLHAGAHASTAAFGGEPFERLARARQDVVARRLGVRRARLDTAAQAVTFSSRIALKRGLGRPTARERRQLAALGALAGAR